MGEIVDPIVDVISVATSSGNTFTNTSNTYDIAVAGLPFFIGASQQYPYKRETAPYRKTQIDQAREPGEQTLTGWWLRSQSSFHLGAGIKYEEPVQGDTVQYRFHKSAGIDPWNIGKVTLLPDVSLAKSVATNAPLMAGGVDTAGKNVVMMADGASLYRYENGVTGTTAVTWGGSTTIKDITQDGANYFVATDKVIYQGALTGTGTGASYYVYTTGATGASNVKLGWVKQRLIAGFDNKLYQVTAAGATLIYTHPNTSWRWTGITDGPNDIYVSGYCGTSSSIFRLALDTAGEVPVLTRALTAADLPGGEYITAITAYIGKYIAIGTNKGVRIATIDTSGYYSSGYITYGPLTVTTNGYDYTYNRTISGAEVTQFAFYDRFVYATVTNYIDNGDGTYSSGLIRIDLSREVQPGQYAWATDLRVPSTAKVSSVVEIGSTGKLMIGVVGVGMYAQATQAVTSGYIQTGLIRHFTLEDKHFKLVKALIQTPVTGNVKVSLVSSAGDVNDLLTITPTIDPTQDIGTNLQSPAESVAFRFTLFPASAGAATGSTLSGYQLKSLPAVHRTRLLTIPLLNYDFEGDRYNMSVGYENRAWDRLSALENIEAIGDTVLVQDFTNGETVQGIIESIQFVRITPPERRFKGFGGIIYLTFRTI